MTCTSNTSKNSSYVSRMSAFRGIRKYLLLLHLTGKTQFKDAVIQDRKRDSQSHRDGQSRDPIKGIKRL